MENATSWLSLHLYSDLRDDLLLKEVLIDILSITQAEWQSFFFVRYNIPSNHLRLRFKSNSQNELKDIIYSLMEKYHHIRDSKFGLLEVAYDPELIRYGGLIGIKIAEQQFYYSSTTALRCIKHAITSYQMSIVYAMRLHTIMLNEFSLCFSIDILAFCKYVFSRMTTSLNIALLLHSNVDELWAKYVIRLEDDLSMPFLDSSVKTLTDDTIVIKIFQDWRDNMCEIGELVQTKLPINTFSDTHYNMQWDIISDYIHMTNNRFGINNVDEPLIMCLIYQMFSKADISGEQIDTL